MVGATELPAGPSQLFIVAWGGAGRRFGPEHSPLAGREARFIIHPLLLGEDAADDERCRVLGRAFRDELRPWSVGASYPNLLGAGFSMGSAIAQELAIRQPELVRSLVLVSTYARPDALFRRQLEFWRWLPEAAPTERAFFEAFFTWVYTPRAHADGGVDAIIEEAMAFPHQQSLEGFQAQVDACIGHDTEGRLSEVTAPSLVLSSEYDIILPPRHGRAVAAEIRGAQFEVLEGQAHQPFQKSPERSSTRASMSSGARSMPGPDPAGGRPDVDDGR